MEELLKIKIQDLAKENFSNIQLFQSYNVDFYCKGGLTLKEALTNSSVNQDEFLGKLKKIQENEHIKYEVDVKNWPLDLLADYIQKTHHLFTDQILVNIRGKINEYLEKGLECSDKITQFKIPFEQLAQELGAHMKREELILFPTIKRIVATRGKLEDPGLKTVKTPVDKMIHEHDTQHQFIKEIRNILNGYSLNDKNPKDYNEIVSLMNDLDLNLSLHLHLENNILFPRALELERSKLN